MILLDVIYWSFWGRIYFFYVILVFPFVGLLLPFVFGGRVLGRRLPWWVAYPISALVVVCFWPLWFVIGYVAWEIDSPESWQLYLGPLFLWALIAPFHRQLVACARSRANRFLSRGPGSTAGREPPQA